MGKGKVPLVAPPSAVTTPGLTRRGFADISPSTTAPSRLLHLCLGALAAGGSQGLFPQLVFQGGFPSLLSLSLSAPELVHHGNEIPEDDESERRFLLTQRACQHESWSGL